MATREDILAAIAEHGSQRKAARALGIAQSTLSAALHGTRDRTPAAAKTVGRSIDEFRNTYDKGTIIPARITAALKQLGSGWDYEVGFSRLAGVSLTDLSAVREQFEAHIVVVDRGGRRAWAGTVATANKMREMVR